MTYLLYLLSLQGLGIGSSGAYSGRCFLDGTPPSLQRKSLANCRKTHQKTEPQRRLQSGCIKACETRHPGTTFTYGSWFILFMTRLIPRLN